MNEININQLSEQLLLQVKLQQPTIEIRTQLKSLDFKNLIDQLKSDEFKKAFWINIYNAYYLILRKEKQLIKPDIYRKKVFQIAGKDLSLDDVEHGILRKYRYKYTLGFLPNLLTKRLIKQLAVDKIDYRIHFALNCGAVSCPPIAFYHPTKIELQLNMATQSFLEAETTYNTSMKIVYTTTLFKWFLGDFGGLKGIKTIYKTQLDKDISDYVIKFKPYSWEENLDNFDDDPKQLI